MKSLAVKKISFISLIFISLPWFAIGDDDDIPFDNPSIGSFFFSTSSSQDSGPLLSLVDDDSDADEASLSGYETEECDSQLSSSDEESLPRSSSKHGRDSLSSSSSSTKRQRASSSSSSSSGVLGLRHLKSQNIFHGLLDRETVSHSSSFLESQTADLIKHRAIVFLISFISRIKEKSSISIDLRSSLDECLFSLEKKGTHFSPKESLLVFLLGEILNAESVDGVIAFINLSYFRKLSPVLVLSAFSQSRNISFEKNFFNTLQARGYGIDDIRLAGGETLLHTAAVYLRNEEAIEVINYFLKKGANPNSQDDLGNTPLHSVISHDQVDSPSYFSMLADLYNSSDYNIVITLLAAGAGSNIANRLGETPLHSAAMRNGRRKSIQIVVALLQNEADWRAQNNQGQTPLLLASRFLNTSIAALLGIIEKNPTVDLSGIYTDTDISTLQVQAHRSRHPLPRSPLSLVTASSAVYQ